MSISKLLAIILVGRLFAEDDAALVTDINSANTKKYLIFPDSEFICEGSDILNATTYGMSLGTAETSCDSDDRCNYIAIHGAAPPVPSFAWICHGEDWIRRTLNVANGFLAINPNRMFSKIYKVVANSLGDCTSPLSIETGVSTMRMAEEGCENDPRCGLIIIRSTPGTKGLIEVIYCSGESAESKGFGFGHAVAIRDPDAPRESTRSSAYSPTAAPISPVAPAGAAGVPQVPPPAITAGGLRGVNPLSNSGPVVLDNYHRIYSLGEIALVPWTRM